MKMVYGWRNRKHALCPMCKSKCMVRDENWLKEDRTDWMGHITRFHCERCDGWVRKYYTPEYKYAHFDYIDWAGNEIPF